MLLLEDRQHQRTYWVVSFLVLASDIFIPVPSSLVMILNGKVLGFFFGTVLSTVSGLVSSVIGFYMGKKSGKIINKFFNPEEQKMSNNLFLKYGNSAIVLSKALPIISEAVSFLAGTTGISLKRFVFLSLVGHLIISAVYAYAGSFSTAFNSNLLSAGIILFVLLVSWLLKYLFHQKNFQKE